MSIRPLRDGSQNAQVLFHLSAGTKLTPALAMQIISPPCFRLAARIHQLSRRGHIIKTDIVESPSGTRYAEYSMPT